LCCEIQSLHAVVQPLDGSHPFRLDSEAVGILY
jgi:hypothetical protein